MKEEFTTILSIATFTVTILSILLLWAIRRAHRKAKEVRDTLESVEQELRSALAKINSSSDTDILSGLQTLSILRDRAVQLKAMPRITDLLRDNDRVIAAQAKATLQKIVQSASYNP